MTRAKGKGGDFHHGVPNKHAGKKGDKTTDIRSSGELRKALESGGKDLSEDAKEYVRSVQEENALDNQQDQQNPR